MAIADPLHNKSVHTEHGLHAFSDGIFAVRAR